MRPVSAGLLRTLRGSHAMVTRARVCTTYQTGTTPVGTSIGIIDGDVVLNGQADVRATLRLDTPARDATSGAAMYPTAVDSLLAPYGNELFIERGVKFGNGTTEWVSQGYYRIEDVDQDEAPNGPISITASDRMAGVIDSKLEKPRQFSATINLGTVLFVLVSEVYPDVTFEFDDAVWSQAAGRPLIAEDDRFAFCNDLVKSAGKIWYFDYRGVVVVKSPPAATSPVWDVNAGRDGVLVKASRSLTRKGISNIVVATGEGGDTLAPARGVARDDSPVSPTYWLGKFGPVPRFYSSPFITTNAQAASAARSILASSLGMPYSVNFQTIPNPALEPFDPVTVTYPDGRVETHVLDQVTVPLTARKVMAATTREQTNVLIATEEGT